MHKPTWAQRNLGGLQGRPPPQASHATLTAQACRCFQFSKEAEHPDFYVESPFFFIHLQCIQISKLKNSPVSQTICR